MISATDWFGDASVFVVDVPLACCALESQAAAGGREVVGCDRIPHGARVVVAISGTITAPMVPAIARVLDAVPDGASVVAFGACACSGGPYWDSYAVTPGAADLVEVDHVIAGCPPPPSALHDYVSGLRGQVHA